MQFKLLLRLYNDMEILTRTQFLISVKVSMNLGTVTINLLAVVLAKGIFQS